MNVGEYCNRSTVWIAGEVDVGEAAKLMREHHVGFLIVGRQADEVCRPIGVITDRDIVVQVVARDLDPHAVTVEDVMTREPLIARESEDLQDVLQAMRVAGVRRVPVVDERGVLSGIMAISDAIDLITEMLCDISGSIKSGQRQERRAMSG